MKIKIRFITVLTICLITLLLNGCSFVPRSPIAFPDELRPLYFSSIKPYSSLSNKLHTLFRSMQVPLVKHKSQAHFSLVISYDNFSYGRPDIVDSTLPTNINYSQSCSIRIVNNRTKKTVESTSFTTTQTITINANQIYTANANGLVKEELNRQMASLIYYWLISSNTKVALHDATLTSSTHHAP